MPSNMLSTTLFLALSTLSAATPLRTRQTAGASTVGLSPMAAMVNSNIQGWQDDIRNVNTFLNTAAAGTLSGAQLATTASQLLVDMPGDAADELNRLGALTMLITDKTQTAALTASNDLMNIFGGVLTNLTVIQGNASNLNNINDAVTKINCLRCNFVLPDIDQVYAGAVASNAGSTLQTTVGPNVCPNPAPGSFTDGC